MSKASTPDKYFNHLRGELAFLIEPSSRQCRILEIGCGDGEFSGFFPKDSEYWGIEPNFESVKIAEKKENLHVLHGTFEEAYDKLPDDYFDLVVCNDVIEHMSDHDRFILDIKKKAAPGAKIIGSIPNVGHISILYKLLIEKDWRYENAGITDRTHLRFFTKKSFARSLDEGNYKIELLQGINPTYFNINSPVNAIQYIALQFAKLIFGSDIQYHQFAFRAEFPPRRSN